MEKLLVIEDDYITLGQMLKHANIIQSGGMAKMFLSENEIYVNGELDNRRGKKLYVNDKVEIKNVGTYIISK